MLRQIGRSWKSPVGGAERSSATPSAGTTTRRFRRPCVGGCSVVSTRWRRRWRLHGEVPQEVEDAGRPVQDDVCLCEQRGGSLGGAYGDTKPVVTLGDEVGDGGE